MQNSIKIIKSFIVEICIICTYIFLINNYIGNVDRTLNADGIGYYDYLPSLFIHHDLIRKDIPIQKDSILYDRIRPLPGYVDHDNFIVNRYPCGTAILELPFFTYTYLTTTLEGNNNDGYQLPFQKTIFHAAIFYLLLSIYFFKKILELYDIRKHIIILSQLLLVLATSVTDYANFDAGFSHVYSLFAITAFFYFIKAYFTHRHINHFIFSCLFLGLILLLRQINILTVLFIPFLAGSIRNFTDGLKFLFINPQKILIGMLLIFGVLFIQCLLWYLQTGHWVIDSYQGYSFNFLDPQIFNILFSYRKGLFVYTPILFISLFGLIWLIYKRNYYLVFTWTAFFILLTYVLSSWCFWYYGCSYGLRAYIDFYSIFFILYALVLNEVPKGIKLIIIILSFLTIPINIIQTYQYKEFILGWDGMNKDKYWKIFLKTSNPYKGLAWKKQYDYSYYSTVKEIFVGNINASKNTEKLICSINSRDIPYFEKVNIIQVLIDNEYNEQNESTIILSINESNTNHNYIWHERYLIHFADKRLNEWQTGLFNSEFTPITDMKEKIIKLEVKSKNENIDLKNIRIKFLKLIK